MSETIQTPPAAPPSPQEISGQKKAAEIAKQKEIDAIVASRAKELKAYEGKTFRPKCPSSRFPNETVKVIAYVGVLQHSIGPAHTFNVESRNPNANWKPIAASFLENYEPFESIEKLDSETTPI